MEKKKHKAGTSKAAAETEWPQKRGRSRSTPETFDALATEVGKARNLYVATVPPAQTLLPAIENQDEEWSRDFKSPQSQVGADRLKAIMGMTDQPARDSLVSGP